MNKRNIANLTKNALGTMFLLAGAFFVCSTFLSMRAVFADPIAPVVTPTANNVASPRANANSRASGRSTAASRVRTTTNTASRDVVSRNVASRANTTASRNVASRNVVARTTTPSRNVVSRTTTPSRISLTGNAIHGNKNAAATTTYTYLSNRLYTGNYSNIIDSTTGLISADAYQNCLDSYYTCMDEICTARSAAQGRCACAARVKSFIQAEDALETANEELIKASGELALFIANKGKDVSTAFQLTDAEKVMNCVSWQEVTSKYGTSSQQAIDWCSSHSIYQQNGGVVTSCTQPKYCAESGNSFGFDISQIEGSSSDILATLQAWADSKESTVKLLTTDDDNLLNAYTNVSNIVTGMTNSTDSSTATLDTLANTWGYELFQYAHNNVCGRVLDSCFNGIYEACGTPPSVTVNNSTGGKTKTTMCANNATSNCPFNYNSKVEISSNGDVTLNERGSTNATTSSSATCFGYSTTTTTSGTTTTTDPYASLRGPVADARRSVMQKYLLDANAACDVYGDTLKKTAQNIGYQKVAAQQALQQKRLEFANEEANTMLANATTAITNFTECIDEIQDCYETMLSSHGPKSSSIWSAARIRTYCAQMSQVPHCYQDMICNPSYSQIRMIVDKMDSTACDNTQNTKVNTCRNIVTLNEILNGVSGASVTGSFTQSFAPDQNSMNIREACLLDAGVKEVRDWKRLIYDVEVCKASGRTDCSAESEEASTPCEDSVLEAKHATNGSVVNGACVISGCIAGYALSNGECIELQQ